MVKFKKGSAEAKAFMAKLRGMRKGSKKNNNAAHRAASQSNPNVGEIKTKRRTNSMPKKKNHSNGNGKSLFRTVKRLSIVGALVAPGVYAYQHPYGNDPKYRMIDGVKSYTGYNMDTGTWTFADLKKGWAPVLSLKLMWMGYGFMNRLFRSV